eukprot:gene14540-16101_t
MESTTNLSALLAMNGIRSSVLKDLTDHGITTSGQLGRKWRIEKSALNFLFQLRNVNKANMMKVLDSAAQSYVNSVRGKEDKSSSSNQTTPQSDKKNRNTTPSNLKNISKVDTSYLSSPPVNLNEDIKKVQEKRTFQPVLDGVVPPIYGKILSLDVPQTPPFAESKVTRTNSLNDTPFSALQNESFKKETAFHSSKVKKIESSTYNDYDHFLALPENYISPLLDRGEILSRRAQDEEKSYTLDMGKSFSDRTYQGPQARVRPVPSKLDDFPVQNGSNMKVALRKKSPPRDGTKGVGMSLKTSSGEDEYETKLQDRLNEAKAKLKKEQEQVEMVRRQNLRERQRQAEAHQRTVEEERQRQKAEAQQRAAEEERQRQKAEAQQRAVEEERQRQKAEAQQRAAEEERQRQKAETHQRAVEEERQRQKAEAQHRAGRERQKAETEQWTESKDRRLSNEWRKRDKDRADSARGEEERQRQKPSSATSEEERQRQKAELSNEWRKRQTKAEKQR